MLKQQFQIGYNVFLHIIRNPPLIINITTSFKVVGGGEGGTQVYISYNIHAFAVCTTFYHHVSNGKEKLYSKQQEELGFPPKSSTDKIQ
jgi:hypothetical protein